VRFQCYRNHTLACDHALQGNDKSVQLCELITEALVPLSYQVLHLTHTVKTSRKSLLHQVWSVRATTICQVVMNRRIQTAPWLLWISKRRCIFEKHNRFSTDMSKQEFGWTLTCF
jgi:hypothetical protein